MQQTRYHAIGFLTSGLMAVVLCGCSGADRSELDILPESDKARIALDTALTAWKNGEKIGSLKGDSYSIQVADRAWTAGKKLTAYEIVGVDDKPGPRWFTVRLTLAGAQPQQVHYAVFGIDPMQVFSEPDYNQMCGMGGK